MVKDPLPALSAGTGRAPTSCVSGIQRGDSTCICGSTRAPGVGWGAVWRAGPGCQCAPKCVFHTGRQLCLGPGFKAMPSQLPRSPLQKRAVKERGRGLLACCSWARCSSRKGVAGPKPPKSPQLIAVILDDDLDSVVPQLSSEQQVLVFQIFHLLSEHVVVQLQLVKPLQFF